MIYGILVKNNCCWHSENKNCEQLLRYSDDNMVSGRVWWCIRSVKLMEIHVRSHLQKVKVISLRMWDLLRDAPCFVLNIIMQHSTKTEYANFRGGEEFLQNTPIKFHYVTAGDNWVVRKWLNEWLVNGRTLPFTAYDITKPSKSH
jgi:hypothetical protein